MSNPPRHLVLLHGLSSTPREFGLLVHPLRRLGITLHAPEIRGYSDASLAPGARWQDWLEAASHAVHGCVGPSQPFILGGLCTGAILALALTARHRFSSLRGLALLSPIFAYNGWGLPWWYRARRLAYVLGIEGRFAMAERPPYGLKDERMRVRVRQLLQQGQATVAGTPRISLSAVRESERMSREAPAWIARLQLRTLVLHAREDEICRLDSVRQAVADAPQGLLQLAVLGNSYHMIAADNDRLEVAQRLAAHVGACLADQVAPGWHTGAGRLAAAA